MDVGDQNRDARNFWIGGPTPYGVWGSLGTIAAGEAP